MEAGRLDRWWSMRRIGLAQLSPMLPGINGSEPKPEQLAMETDYA